MLNIKCIRYGKGSHEYTSDDKWLYFELDDDAFTSVAKEEELQNVQNINGKFVRCTYGFGYLSKYDRDAKKTDDTTQKYLETLFDKHYKAMKKREYDDRKDKGYINHVKAFSNVEPEDYYGLLGKYLTKETLKYIEGGCVFGYLGHEDRTKETDKVICEFLDEHSDMKERVNREFLCSGVGRHYMDNYSGPEDLRKFLAEL